MNTFVTRALLLLGRGEELLAALPRAFRIDGSEEQLLAVDAREALALVHLGRVPEARAALGRVLTQYSIGLEGDERAAPFLTFLLEAAVLVGDREAAALLAGHLGVLAPLPWLYLAQTCPARHLGAAAALLGEPEKAKPYYQQALEVCAKIRFRPEIALTRLQLAELLLEHYRDARTEAIQHLDFAIAEFQEMKMQPSLERVLRHKGLLKA